jgi:predicted pyridoxine 5'-phosphate oxidase superfamily flavin-nucleotide-binding protein
MFNAENRLDRNARDDIQRPVRELSIWKEIDHINELYRQFIEASPFLILATCGDKGVDCSPRGDALGFVRVVAPDCIQDNLAGE